MGQDDQVGQGADPDVTSPHNPAAGPYEYIHAEDTANEVRIFWGEIAVIAVLALLAAIYAILS